MNKYEFQQRIEEGEELMAHGQYMEAVTVFDELNLDLIRQPVRLEKIAKGYEHCRRYRDAEELLLLAHERAPMSRSILFHLCTIAIKESRDEHMDPKERAEDLEVAKKYYREFARMTPPDPKRFVLQYRLARAENKGNDVLISILEKMRAEVPDDRWMYELARLYAEEKRIDLALDVCHDIDVWFNGGIYLQKSKELRAEMLGERLPIELTEEKMPSDTTEDQIEITREEREFAAKQDNYLDELKDIVVLPEIRKNSVEEMREKDFPDEVDMPEELAEAENNGVTESMIRDFEESFRNGELDDEEDETENENIENDVKETVATATETETATTEQAEAAEENAEPDEYVMVKVTKSPTDIAEEFEDIEIKNTSEDIEDIEIKNAFEEVEAIETKAPAKSPADDYVEDLDDFRMPVNADLDLPKDEPEEEEVTETMDGLPLNPIVTENTWHFMVFGDTNKLALECARENIREIMTVNPQAPEKILKIHSSKMEGVNIVNSIDQFLGSMVIVEEAASLTDEQLADFSKVLDRDDRSLLVCFSDSRLQIHEMLTRIPELRKSFSAIFEAKDYSVEDLVKFAKAYCRESEAKLTREAEEEVRHYAQRILTEQRGFYKNSILDLVDDAIGVAEHSGVLRSGKTDKSGNLLITEKHIRKVKDA